MAAVAELAILDGHYQLLRQIGGRPNAPLMLASDLRRGVVVCVRLKRFNAAMARLAAVPRLAPPAGADAGPLLPFDFGVDGDIAYLVRPYAAAVSLEARLADGDPLPPLAALRIVTSAGQALLAAAAQGFLHPGLKAKHVLITPVEKVCIAGFDALGQSPVGGPADGRALAGLLRAALAQQPSADLPSALRRLLVTLATWERRGFPSLRTAVHELVQTEAWLSGNAQPALALRAAGRAVRGAGRRVRRLGPLLRPYLITAGLLAGTAAVSAAALSAHGGTNHIVVYAVAPAPAAVDPAPRPITIATAAPRQAATTSAAATSDATTRAAFAAEQIAATWSVSTTARLATTWSSAPSASDARGAEETVLPATAQGAERSRPTLEAARPSGGDQRAPTATVRRSAPRQTVTETVTATRARSAAAAPATTARATITTASVTAVTSRASATGEATATAAASVTTAAASATTVATRSQVTASARAAQTAASSVTTASSTAVRATTATTNAATSVATRRASGTTVSRGTDATASEAGLSSSAASTQAAAR